MSEASRQQNRESPTDTDSMDHQATESPNYATGPNNIVLWSQPSGQINYDVDERPKEEDLRPYNDERSQLTQRNRGQDSRYDYENANYAAMRAAEIQSNLLLRHAGGYGSRPSMSMQPDREPLYHGSHAPDYHGLHSMDSTERLGPNPMDSARGFLPQGYPSERNGHPFFSQNDGYQEHPSRPAYQDLAPTYHIDGQPVFDYSHQHHNYGALEEPYPTADYPVQQTGYMADAFPPEHRFDSYGQYSQEPQGPNPFPEAALPPFRPNFEPSHPAPLASSRDAKFNKLCNNHHLRGGYILRDACRYVHGTISQEQLQDLRRIAKRTPCKLGLNCNDKSCYAGHKCPYNPCSGKCVFPAELHYDGPEYVPGRPAMRVEGYQVHHPKKKQSKHQSGGLQGMPPVREHRSSREDIRRDVDELMNEIASPGDSPSKSSNIMGSPLRKTTEREMTPFEDMRTRSHQGSQASTPPRRRSDMPRYVPARGRRVSTLGEYRVEKRSGKDNDDAGSHGRARRQGRRGRSSRGTSTHSQRPMEGRGF